MFQVQLLLEGKPSVSMEVDTGSALSIVFEVEYKKWFKHLKLQPRQFHLKTYSGESQVVCALRSLSIMGGIQNLIICVKMAWSEHLGCGGNIR